MDSSHLSFHPFNGSGWRRLPFVVEEFLDSSHLPFHLFNDSGWRRLPSVFEEFLDSSHLPFHPFNGFGWRRLVRIMGVLQLSNGGCQSTERVHKGRLLFPVFHAECPLSGFPMLSCRTAPGNPRRTAPRGEPTACEPLRQTASGPPTARQRRFAVALTVLKCLLAPFDLREQRLVVVAFPLGAGPRGGLDEVVAVFRIFNREFYLSVHVGHRERFALLGVEREAFLHARCPCPVPPACSSCRRARALGRVDK